MCGVAGIFAYNAAAGDIDRTELHSMNGQMRARGPDGEGIWTSDDGRIGLAHRRLAIIDLTENGRQPMQTPDGRLVISFNGEIYNYKELRADLRAAGYQFRTESDTEVLLHLYAQRGINMVRDLRGMFAFALWDSRERRLLLARDPFGIKPLYYSDDGRACRFASQVKAILATGKVAKEPDLAGQVGFYLFGSVPEPFTIWSSIRSVPSGATIVVDSDGLHEPQSYYSVAASFCEAERQPGAVDRMEEEVRDALQDSVRSHLVADVPVGIFLSAGIDSGALAGLMRDVGAQDVTTVTVGFEEFRGRSQDETVLASEVARRYRTRHTTRIVDKAEFEADLPLIMAAMDQPSIDGINTWFVAKAAREAGLKVAISGLGGDELLGGYPSFRKIPRMVGALALPARLPLPRRWFRKLATALQRGFGLHPKAAGLLDYGATYAGAYLLNRGLYLPWELDAVLGPEVAAAGLSRLLPVDFIQKNITPCPNSGFARIATLESTLYLRNQLLRDTDWASMAHSLEIRVPLVDRVLFSRLAPLMVQAGTRGGKRLLASAPSTPLPHSVANRRKTGFTTPVSTWMATLLAPGLEGIPEGPWARGWSRFVAASEGIGG